MAYIYRERNNANDSKKTLKKYSILSYKGVGYETSQNRLMFLQYFEKTFLLRPAIKTTRKQEYCVQQEVIPNCVSFVFIFSFLWF